MLLQTFYLAEDFSGKPVEIISICLDSDQEKWRTIIKNHDFRGINLICAGNWASDLQEKYSVAALPHYALVDGGGQIVSERCEGPAAVHERLVALLESDGKP